MEHNTGFSEDPEEGTPLVSSSKKNVRIENKKMEQYLKPALFIAIGCFLIASISFVAAHYSAQNDSFGTSLIDGASSGLAQYKLKTVAATGATILPPIKEGCAYLFNDDPSVNPGATGYAVCNEGETEYTAIGDVGFPANSPTSGISYLITAPNTWVTLYENANTEGVHTIFGPHLSLSLAKAADGNWADRAQSLVVRKKIGDQAFLVSKTLNIAPGANCALLFGSNPKADNATRAIELCGKVGAEQSLFTYYGLILQYGLTVDKLEGGISYVITGPQCQLTLYSGQNNDQSSLVVNPGTSQDLNEIYDATSNNGITWSDVPLSFKLVIVQPPSPSGSTTPTEEQLNAEANIVVKSAVVDPSEYTKRKYKQSKHAKAKK